MNLPEHLILFDGDCAFCNQSVQFILKQEDQKMFFFSSLQSETGIAVKQEFGIPKEYSESLLYIRYGKLLAASEAAVWISVNLKFPFNLLAGAYLIPSGFRNKMYLFIAKNRKSFLSNKTTCFVYEENQKHRFI